MEFQRNLYIEEAGEELKRRERFTQQFGKFLRGTIAESSNWGHHLKVPLVKRLTMKDKDCKIKNHICRIKYRTVILYVNKDWFIHRSSLTKLLRQGQEATKSLSEESIKFRREVDESKKFPVSQEYWRNSEQYKRDLRVADEQHRIEGFPQRHGDVAR